MQGYRSYRPPIMVLVKSFQNGAGQSRWSVRRKKHGKEFNLGWFDTEQKAYAALARRWPAEKKSLTKKALLRAEVASKTARGKSEVEKLKLAPKRLWQGISFEADRRCWKVQPSGPRFPEDQQQEAARCAARKNKCSLASLQLEGAIGQRKRSLEATQQEFLMGMKMKDFIMPGDAEDVEWRVKHKPTIRSLNKQPGILPVFFVSKLVATRKLMVNQVQSTPVPTLAKREGLPPQVRHLYMVLVRCVAAVSKTRWPDSHRLAYNKTQYHWMNFWRHTWRIGFLQTTVDQDSQYQQGYTFDAGAQKYFIQSLSPSLAISLQHQIDWGATVLALSKQRHETVQDAAKICTALSQACPSLEGCKNQDAYVRQWLNRCAVYWCMRSKGVKKMTVSGFSVRQFLDLDFPDEKQQVFPILKSPGSSPNMVMAQDMQEILDALGYDAPPELLHMYACLLADSQYRCLIRSKDDQWLQRHRAILRRWAIAYKKEHGCFPHPRKIVSANKHLP